MSRIIDPFNVSPIKQQLIQLGSTLNPPMEQGFADYLSDDECSAILESLQEYARNENSRTHQFIYGEDFEEVPVSFETFIQDRDFLGYVGNTLYDKWKEELSMVLHPESMILEWILSGCIGSGKSTVSNVAQLYKLYRLLCLKKPVEYYDLMGEGMTQLAMGLFNGTLDLAYKVNFKQLAAMMQTSPWFKERVKTNRTGSWVTMGKDVNIVLGSDQMHIIGQAAIGAIMDESDFGKNADADRMYETYNAVFRRIESRFMKHLSKSPPGLLILISSTVQDDQSFLNQRIAYAEEHPEKTHISKFAIWDIKPVPVEFGTDKFKVFIGDELRPPTMLDPLFDKTTYDSDKVIEVPVAYKSSFDKDLEKAILDLAGVRIGSSQNKYLPSVSYFRQMIERYGDTPVPMKNEFMDISLDSTIGVHEAFVSKNYFKYYLDRGMNLPIYNPDSGRFIHIDLAKNGDAAGFAIVHFDRWVTQQVDEVFYKLPSFRTDIMMQFTCKSGSEIHFKKIQDFIVYLHKAGMPIAGISLDSYQSVEFLQNMKIFFPHLDKLKRLLTLSVDKPDPYNALRPIIMDGRHMCYPHAVAAMEFKDLRRDPETQKVDHPREGCFTGDTEIRLLDGTVRRLDSFTRGDQFWVYGCEESGEVVPTLAKHLGVTKRVDELVEVTFDTGESVRCTPEHRFMLRDGSYIEAQFLTSGMSLMPLYRQLNNKGYESVLDNKTSEWVKTHKMVATSLLDKPYDGVVPEGHRCFVVHHKNRVKTDNRPKNLEWMTWKDHKWLHANLFNDWLRINPEYLAKMKVVSSAVMQKNWQNPEFRVKVSEAAKKQIRINVAKSWENGYNERLAHVRRITPFNPENDPESIDRVRKALSEASKTNWQDPDFRKRVLDSRRSYIDSIRGTEKFDRILTNLATPRAITQQEKDASRSRLKDNNSKGSTMRGRIVNAIKTGKFSFKLETVLKYFDSVESANKCATDPSYYANYDYRNHKVTSVKFIYVPTTAVYDIETSTSNFALAKGVFVHNSKDVADALCGATYHCSLHYPIQRVMEGLTARVHTIEVGNSQPVPLDTVEHKTKRIPKI